jgi:CRP/FNR family transcriptional regulator, cyclic AMP receptor protein
VDPERLRSVPLFAGLEKRELEAIGRCADQVDVREGELLIEEGDFGYEFFAIEDGRAEVRRDEETIAELEPGDFFGEAALVGDARRNASVVATSPLKVIVMTRQAFRQLRNDVPTVCDRITAAVKDRGVEPDADPAA